MKDNVPVIINIESSVAGIVKINDGVAGEVGGEEGKRVITQVSGKGTFYISFLPLSSSYERMAMPLIRRIIIGNTVSIFEDDGLIEVLCMPGMYLIRIKPLFISSGRGEIKPQMFGRFIFQSGGISFVAGIYQEKEVYIFLEEERRGYTVFAYPLWFRVKSASVLMHKIGDSVFLLYTGESSEGDFCFGVQISPEIRFIDGFLNAKATVHLDSLVFNVVEKDNGIKKNYYFTSENGQIILKSSEINMIEGCENIKTATALLFLDSVLKNRKEESLKFLTMQLLDGLCYEDICEFLGPFSKITTKSPFKEGNIITLWYKKSSNVYDIRCFSFEFYKTSNDNYLIDNISEA
ncbi:MAG: hypothetical protein R2876_06795 [Eubacteriales bacterium]